MVFHNLKLKTRGKKLVSRNFLYLNPLTANVPHHTETSQLIYNANQLTGFNMMENNGR